jgi:hypothetical protein
MLMMVVLGDVILFVVPGLGAVVFGYRWLRTKVVVSGLRMDAVKAYAELGAAREAARLSLGREREQRAIIGDAVQVAKAAVHTDQIVTQLADWLRHEVGWRAGEVSALPGAPGWEPSAAGELEEGGRP